MIIFGGSAGSCDSKAIILIASFHELEVPNDLEDCFGEVGACSVLPFFLYSGDKGGVFAFNIHKHSGLEVRFGATTCIWKSFNK